MYCERKEIRLFVFTARYVFTNSMSTNGLCYNALYFLETGAHRRCAPRSWCFWSDWSFPTLLLDMADAALPTGLLISAGFEGQVAPGRLLEIVEWRWSNRVLCKHGPGSWRVFAVRPFLVRQSEVTPKEIKIIAKKKRHFGECTSLIYFTWIKLGVSDCSDWLITRLNFRTIGQARPRKHFLEKAYSLSLYQANRMFKKFVKCPHRDDMKKVVITAFYEGQWLLGAFLHNYEISAFA